jgi:hypothetical protein
MRQRRPGNRPRASRYSSAGRRANSLTWRTWEAGNPRRMSSR